MESITRKEIKTLINLNIGFFGIAVCWSVLMSNMSTIFTFLGATPSEIAYFWLVPPLTGMTMQPIIGYLSDITTTRYGKRRPYILPSAVVIFLLCILLSFANSLFLVVLTVWLLFGVVNIAQQVMRLLIADVLPLHRITLGFSILMVFFGLGNMVGSVMPWLLQQLLPDSIVISSIHLPLFFAITFCITGTIVLMTVLWTCFTTREENNIILDHLDRKPFLFSELKNIFSHSSKLPHIMKQIFIAQFCAWVGFFTMFAYFNLSIAQTLFGLPPGADAYSNASYRLIMEKATAYNSICFFLFQLSGFLMALLIPFLEKIIPRKIIVMITCLIGGLGLLGIMLNPAIFYKPAAFFAGCAYGSTMAIYFSMAASHSPKGKTGLYMGLLSIAICLPQIISGLLLASIIKFLLHDYVVFAVSLSGIFLLLAGIFSYFIDDNAGERKIL